MSVPVLSRFHRFLIAVVRTVVGIAPSKLISIFFEACGEALHRKGSRFVTWHTRAKRPSAEALYCTQPLLPAKEDANIGVVMQGPLQLQDNFTLETARFYRRIWPDARLIVSTWNSENAAVLDSLRALGCEVILSERPAVPGLQNVNFQVRSSYAGIARAKDLGCAFVAKTRTDQRVGNPRALGMLVDLLQQFPVMEGKGQRARIVLSSFITAAFTPFYFSDQFLFGCTADLADYFSAPEDSRKGTASFDNQTLCDVNVPENYLATAFLKRHGRDTTRSLAASWRALAMWFLVVDRDALDMYWPKYTPHTEHPCELYKSQLVWSALGFQDWLRIYRCLGEGVDVPEELLNRPANEQVPERIRAT